MTDIENIANVISDMSIKYTKPIVASFIGGDVTQQGAKILDQKHIPCYNYPERAIRALSRVYFQTQNQPIPLSELTNTHQKLETTEVGLLGFSQAQALLA
jgi:acetyltransferase